MVPKVRLGRGGGDGCSPLSGEARWARPQSRVQELIRVPSQSKDAGGVAGRYASALYELAESTADSAAESAKVLDAVAGDLRTLDSMLEISDDFARLVSSPVLTRGEQVAAVTAVARKAGFCSLTVKFVGLLAQNRRLAGLGSMVEISDDFARLAQRGSTCGTKSAPREGRRGRLFAAFRRGPVGQASI